MTKNPLISICIPVYNAELFIAKAITSCLNQTYSNVEIICVNDGSSDASLEIIQSFGSDIKIVDGDHKGAQAARNKAFSHSSGEFINFFDADNLLMPNKLAIQAEYLRNDLADLVFAKRAIAKKSGEVEYLPPLPSPDGIDPFIYCLKYNSPGGRARIDTDVALHRRSFIEKIGGFREGVVRGQDKDLAFRMTAAGARLKYIDEFVTIYRDHENPRISDIKKQGNFNVNYFISLVNEINNNSCFHLSKPAKQELISKLVWSAKLAFRSGFKQEAIEGFKLAINLAPKGDIKESASYRVIRSVIGYPQVEKLISLLKLK